MSIPLRKVADAQMSWPPSAPEFKSLCQPVPSDFGIPDMGAAWIEATSKSYDPHNAQWSHVAVKTAAQRTGWWDLQRAEVGDKAIQKRFEYHYSIIVRSVMAGTESSDVPEALEHQAQPATEIHDQQAEQDMQERMRERGINPNGGRAEFLKQLGRK